MEKAFFEALMEVALSERVDQWGNKIISPLNMAIDKWAEKNKEEISKIVIKNIGLEGLAIKVSELAIKALTNTNNTWGEKADKEKLMTRVNEIMAEKLAEEQLRILQS
jgi:hypothetical protein